MSGTERDRERGQEERRPKPRRRWGWAVAAGLGLATGAILGLGLPAGGSPTPGVPDPSPFEALAPQWLEVAKRHAPYAVKLPTFLPPGTELENAAWGQDPTPLDPEWTGEPDRVFVDVWYRLPTGGRLSISRTDSPGAGTWVDDFEPIEVVTIAGQGWKLARMPASQLGVEFLQLSTTFPDGVTFFMAAPAKEVPVEVLTQVAASVQPTEPPIQG
mgnify:CR=1 FL=1